MAVLSLDYGLLGRNNLIRPGFMPFLAGGLMALFGVAIGFQALRQHRNSRARASARGETPESVPETEGRVSGGSGKRVAVVFGLTFVTILAAPVIGFILAFGLLILVLLALVEREPVWLALLISVAASLTTWLIFVYFLRIPLPSGFL